MPHLLCYLAIDEIDALVPKRSGKEGEKKGDIVATLLSLIGGIKDVPNLIFIGSTNFANKIDEAMSRRMSDKFFVGRLLKDARLYLIDEFLNKADFKKIIEKEIHKLKVRDSKSKMNKIENDSDSDDDYFSGKSEAKNINDPLNTIKDYKDVVSFEDLKNLNGVLINFTPAAIISLIEKIKIIFLEKLKSSFICKKTNKIIGLKTIVFSDLREIAKKTAFDFNIFFGFKTLFELLDSVDLKKPSERTNLNILNKTKGKPTGLIIADLVNQNYMIKTENNSEYEYEEVNIKHIKSLPEL